MHPATTLSPKILNKHWNCLTIPTKLCGLQAPICLSDFFLIPDDLSDDDTWPTGPDSDTDDNDAENQADDENMTKVQQ